MNRNAVYTGCLTGVAVVIALFYPLYVILPKSSVAGWQSGSETLGLLLSIVATLMLVVGGMLAARWGRFVTRRHAALLGALAGAIAGTMAFAALGAAAAGVIGLGNITDGEPHRLGHAIVQMANFTYITLWGMPLVGAVLGAFGGLLTPRGARVTEKEDELALRIAEVLSIRLLLVSLLILIVSIATIPILLGSQNAGQQAEVIALFNWSVGSGFAAYLAILLWIRHLTQNRLAQNVALFRKRQVNDQLYVAALLSVFALLVMVSILLSGNGSSQRLESPLLLNPIFLIGALASLALSGSMLRSAVRLSKQRRAAAHETETGIAQSKEEPRRFRSKENIPLVAFMGGTAFALPPLTLVPLVINLTRGVVPMLAHLEGTSDSSAVADGIALGIVQDIFRSQALVAYGVFLLGAVSILFSISLALGLSKLRRRALD